MGIVEVVHGCLNMGIREQDYDSELDLQRLRTTGLASLTHLKQCKIPRASHPAGRKPITREVLCRYSIANCIEMKIELKKSNDD